MEEREREREREIILMSKFKKARVVPKLITATSYVGNSPTGAAVTAPSLRRRGGRPSRDKLPQTLQCS